MDLEQRFARLERSNRRMKRIGALVLMVAAAVVLSGAANGKDLPDLEVGSLTLKDKDGKVRAQLGEGADGSGQLRLYDKNGKRRAMLSALADGTGVHLSNKAGTPRASLAVLADGSSGLVLSDKDGKTGAALRARPAQLRLYDKAGKPRALLSAAADWSATLILFVKDVTPRAVLDVDADDGSPSLTLFDAKRKVIWQAPR